MEKLGLLQILSAYIYPSANSEIANRMAKEHQKKVCEAIYAILLSFSKIDIDSVKEFLQFDKLNDVFLEYIRSLLFLQYLDQKEQLILNMEQLVLFIMFMLMKT